MGWSSPRVAFALAMLALGSALGGPPLLPPVPWPGGQEPTEVELQQMVQAATTLADRERGEAFLEALEQGEALEHLLVPQEAIDQGLWSLDRLFLAGDAFFEHRFAPHEGFGAGPLAPLRRVHTGLRGGPDSFSCSACHSQGGPDGSGSEVTQAFFHGDGDRVSSSAIRDAPAVLGLGLVQALGDEMSRDLAWARTQGAVTAATTGQAERVVLQTHGVAFGTLLVNPDGGVEASEVQGVDADLVVRPFGWRGTQARLRRVIEEAARLHSGLQAVPGLLLDRERADPARFGDGADWFDRDADGIYNEVTEGTLTAAAVYLELLEVPVVLPPSAPALLSRWSRGRALFSQVGCEACHRETLALRTTQWVERPDSTGGPGVAVRLLADGEAPRGSDAVHLFSDLKRNAMGGGLAQLQADGSSLPAEVFLTRPLWGLADTAPYLHDGRAGTIPEAILAHGGEAEDSREAFSGLDAEAQADLHVFLLSLTRTPKARFSR